MSYKSIERSREARLWIGQVIMPTVTAVAGILSIPGTKEAILEKYYDIKRSIKIKNSKKGD